MQEGGVFFGKNQVRKADTGDRARRARTQDRKVGEVGLAVLAARAGPNGKESVADTEGASEGRAGKSGKSGPLCSSGEEAGGYRGSRSKSTNTGPEGRGSRARGISYESRTLGEGGEGGKDGHFGTEMDKMARKWTIWQGSDMWHRHCTIYGEIAIGKELATSDTALLNRKSNSCLRSPRCEHFVRFTSGTPRQQLLQTANNANCLTWVFGIKQDDEARKFRRIYYDTCNVS